MYSTNIGNIIFGVAVNSYEKSFNKFNPLRLTLCWFIIVIFQILISLTNDKSNLFVCSVKLMLDSKILLSLFSHISPLRIIIKVDIANFCWTTLVERYFQQNRPCDHRIALPSNTAHKKYTYIHIFIYMFYYLFFLIFSILIWKIFLVQTGLWPMAIKVHIIS